MQGSKKQQYRDSQDNILGVNFNRMSGMGQTFREFMQISKDDAPIQRAFIKGRLTRRQARLLNALITIAPQHKGTQDYVLNYISNSMGENGWQTLIGTMIAMGIAVPEWGKFTTEVEEKNQRSLLDRLRRKREREETEGEYEPARG